MCFTNSNFVEGQFRSRRHFAPGKAYGYFSPPVTHIQDKPR
jgi:hypothetical protein